MPTMGEHDERITRQLVPGETVLWSGRPGRRFPVAGLIFVLALWLTGLAIFIASRATVALFFLIAVTFLVAAPTVAGAISRDVAYGLTDRRVLIVRGRFRPLVRSLPLHWVTNVTITENPDGTGTINLDASDRWTLANRVAPAFEAIAEARRVHGLIVQAQSTLLSR